MSEILNTAETAACRQLETQGYTVLEGLLDAKEAERLDARGRVLMAGNSGYVKLEGALNPIPELAPLCIHPAVLRLAKHFLGAPFYLVNNACMMWGQHQHPPAPHGRQRRLHPPLCTPARIVAAPAQGNLPGIPRAIEVPARKIRGTC